MDTNLQPGQYVFVDEVPEPKSTGSDIGRHVARTTARAAESALGVPGDIANLALSGANLVHRGITGQWSPGIEKAQGYLPTTENIREYATKPLAKKIGGEAYLTPQSEAEQVSDRFVSDLVSILTPAGVAGALGKGAKFGKAAIKGAALTAGAGNAAGWAAKKYTGSQVVGDAVHAATMIGTSLGLNGSMQKQASKMYDEVKQAGSTAHVSTSPLTKGIDATQELLVSKAATKGGKALSDFLDKSAKPMANKKSLTVTELIDLNQGLNKVISQNRSISSDARSAMDSIKKAIDSSIKQSANPSLYETYKGADTLYKEALSASKIQDFVKDVVDSTPFKYGAGGVLFSKLFGIGTHHVPDLLTMAPGAAALGGLYGLGSIAKRIPGLADPTIRRYYIQAARAAADGSRPGVIKALHSVEKYAKGKNLNFEAPQQEVDLKPGEYVFLD